MIRAILFDLDNTLVDHTSAERAAMLELCRHHPALTRAAAPGEVCDAFAAINAELWLSYGRGEMTVAELRLERKRRLIRWCADRPGREVEDRDDGRPASNQGAPVELDPGLLSELYLERYVASVRAYDGVPEMLEALDGRYRLGIVTNGFVAAQRGKLENTGIGRYLPVRVYSEELGVGKPDPAIFREALARVDAAPHETLFVGDSFDNDIRGASLAGMHTVWYHPDGIAGLPADIEIRPLAIVGTIPDLHDLLTTGLSIIHPAA